MGFYYDSTTDEEDWSYMQKLIDSGEAHYKDNKIYRKRTRDEDLVTDILWVNCPIDTKETFPDEEPPKKTPWGVGKFTNKGCDYIYNELMKEGRFTSTL